MKFWDGEEQLRRYGNIFWKMFIREGNGRYEFCIGLGTRKLVEDWFGMGPKLIKTPLMRFYLRMSFRPLHFRFFEIGYSRSDLTWKNLIQYSCDWPSVVLT